MADKGSQMFWKGAKGIIAALDMKSQHRPMIAIKTEAIQSDKSQSDAVQTDYIQVGCGADLEAVYEDQE